MGVTVGEVEAVLKARDAMSAVVLNANANVGVLNDSLKTLNATQSSVKFNDFASGAGDAKVSLAGMKGETDGVSAAAAGLGSVLTRVASAAAIGAFIKSAVDAGAEAAQFAEQLKVDANWLQRVGAAAKQGSGDINDATSSITYMQRAIAGGDGSVVQALTDMHLNLNTIRGMNPQEMFTAITDAAQGMPDPIKQTDAVMTLLGRNAGVFLPAIRQGFKNVTEGAIAMSSESSAALDRLENKIGQILTGTKVLAGETIGQLSLVYEQLTGTGAFDVHAVLEKIMAETKGATGATAALTEDSLARIRRASADLEVIFASAARDGFQAQRAAAEQLHDMQVKDIEATVASDEEKHVRQIEEEKRYSGELFQIKTEEARTVRSIQEQSAAAIISRQGELLNAQLALELSAAALSRGTAESIAAAKAAITTRYAGEEYNAKVHALDMLEQAEAINADRTLDTAEKKAAALLSIHQDYENRRLILATQSQAQLNTQVEALEAQHLARMGQLGMTSGAQHDASTLTPQQAAVTAQHQDVVSNLEAAQKKALAMGDTQSGERIQRLLDEEAAAFVRAMQEGGAAVSDLAPKVEGAGERLTGALDRVTKASSAAAETWTVVSGRLYSDSLNGTSGDAAWRRAHENSLAPNVFSQPLPRAGGGPVSAGRPYIVGENEPELFVPGSDGSIVPSLRGGGGGVTVHVHASGILMSSDPRAHQQFAATISDIVSREVKKTRKLGTN